MPDPETPDPVTAYLDEVQARTEAATPGPWWSDQSEDCYRLHGVAFRIPAQPCKIAGDQEAVIPEQIVNKQIAKAPKRDTPYAEYWPDPADDAFITNARTDVPRLLAALDAVRELHPRDHQRIPLCEGCDYRWPCPTLQAISRALLGEGESGA